MVWIPIFLGICQIRTLIYIFASNRFSLAYRWRRDISFAASSTDWLFSISPPSIPSSFFLFNRLCRVICWRLISSWLGLKLYKYEELNFDFACPFGIPSDIIHTLYSLTYTKVIYLWQETFQSSTCSVYQLARAILHIKPIVFVFSQKRVVYIWDDKVFTFANV